MLDLLRDRVPVYWTHCGSYRLGPREAFYTSLGYDPIRTMDDLVAVARDAVKQGYRDVVYLSTEVDLDPLRTYEGFGRVLKAIP